MALVDNVWYTNFGNGTSTGWWAVTAWATGTVIAAGALRRQNAAPANGNERVFVCIVGGTTHATTEPTWVLTRGGKTTDNTVTWQECTGIAALNGDATNTPTWTITATPPGGVKNTAVTLGQVIKRDNAASYQICTTAGTAGNGAEPAFSNTAGTTTADNTVTWTSLGVVGNFTGWQAPHARITNAIVSTWGQNGNTFYVNSASQETSTSNQLIAIGAVGSPCYFICVGSGNVPPTSADVTTGGLLSETGGNSLRIASSAGNVQYWDGINISMGTSGFSYGMAFGAGSVVAINNATVTCPSSGPTLVLGSQGGVGGDLIFNNVQVSFGAVGNSIALSTVKFEWKNTASALIGAAVPTTLFTQAGGQAACGSVVCKGLDLSAAGSGKTLVSNSASMQTYFGFLDCKLGASVTIGTPGLPGDGVLIDLVNCDSGAVNYRNERWSYGGAKTTETTITRTSGASDGTQSFSNKIITTANSNWAFPFNDQAIPVWIDSAGVSKTITLYGIWGGGAVPNNDDFWIDVDYLSSSGSPISSRATSGKANLLATGSALTSDTSTWGGSTTKFKTSVTFTPQQKGFAYVTVRAGKASSTFYYDPKVDVA